MNRGKLIATSALFAVSALALTLDLPFPDLPFLRDDETPEVVVDVADARAIADYLDGIGYPDLFTDEARLDAIPRLRVDRVPKQLSRAWLEDRDLRKSLFYRLSLSAVLQVNEKILADRQRLQGLPETDLSKADRAWLDSLAEHYEIPLEEGVLTPEQHAELLHRVDALPPSMVMVQGAIESGWLQSRFAREGQALFGQWTSSKAGLKARDSDVRIATFDNPRQSLIAYMRNINTHPSYAPLRKDRAQMRKKGEALDGHALAAHLGPYAETGAKYVKLIRRIIREDALAPLDTAALADGPRVLLRRGGQAQVSAQPDGAN